jgi:hypothetical protein
MGFGTSNGISGLNGLVFRLRASKAYVTPFLAQVSVPYKLPCAQVIGGGPLAKTIHERWSAGCSIRAEQIARENRMSLSSRRSCFGMLACTIPLVAAACVGPPQLETRNIELDLRSFVAATNDTIACRATAAQNPRYRILAERMPLTDIGSVSLSQMTDPGLVTRAQMLALVSES